MAQKSLIKCKTTWAGISSIIAGVGGLVTGTMDIPTAAQLIIAGFATIFIRDAINSASK